jgi:hypothetical protein
MRTRMICMLAAIATLLAPAIPASGSRPPDDAGTGAGHHSSSVIDGPCFRVPIDWLVADSGPVPMCRR